MIKNFVRITCRVRGFKSAEYDVVLDALLDGDQLLALPWFGVARYPNSKYPFQLDMNGRADFGSAYEDNDRYWETKLRSIAIRLGESFSIIEADKTEYTYEIREIGVLLRGGALDPELSARELEDGTIPASDER